jgi:hypothetical protein
MTLSSKTFVRLRARKPLGGYILLTVQQLCLLWWLYRTRRLQLLDVRVWFAAHEMVARRCQLAPAQVPTYNRRELQTLIGGGRGERLRASLRRLDHLGLLAWSPQALTFATSPDDVQHVEDFTGFLAMLDKIPNHHRRIPVPRQTIRLIAARVRPAVLATILGTCFRCLYYHAEPQHVASGGWCKGSWIADVFALHLRTIKAARRHLGASGWLLTFQAPQRTTNRWGTYTQVSLTWEPEAGAAIPVAPPPPAALFPAEQPPPSVFSPPQSPPLLHHQEPFQEFQHQETAAQAAHPLAPSGPVPSIPPRASGSKNPGVEHKTPDKIPSPPSPTLRHIVLEDLRDTTRLLGLLTQAQDSQLVGRSASARLAFVATAEHARAIGHANPCGLFATLVRQQRWHFATVRDEDAAQARLKQYDYGARQSAPLSQAPLAPPPLSQDAFTVQVLRHDLARAGFHGALLPVLQRQDPAWTWERWERACTELHAAAARHRVETLQPVGDGLGAVLGTTAG